MGERICVDDDCGRIVIARGLCTLHYQRWRKEGGPAQKARGEFTPWERFWPKIDVQGDCWVWTAGRTSDGYGRFRINNQTRALAHRWAWEALIGEIPDGLQLDHLCKNEPCVNPDHLEPVTQLLNSRRSSIGWNSRQKTHCPQGHPYAGENLAVYGGRRHCLICRRSGDRKRWHERSSQGMDGGVS